VSVRIPLPLCHPGFSQVARASAFLNIRVADVQAAYEDWRAKGATFLTPPKDHGREIRCYMRDPDGHLIEVGQTVLTLG
jgi:catechol 2,3-dioxygenase-like lactoylglutathione lyase family enzyme